MYSSIAQPVNITWQSLTQLLTGLWKRLYTPRSPYLALPAPPPKPAGTTQYQTQKEEEMPRTRRRHHSRDRSSAGTRDKRRRLDTADHSPPMPEAPSPPRITKTHHTRSAAKRRRHELDAKNAIPIPKEPT
ncbi:serine/threonine-protein kinase Doa [Drosophila madeirensis]|uniref:Serine/threonine-protein kinase Doa n=1 Tax=Drosophila madeirensis TaxID=30013 RepID=A0AAU9EYR0_DROMD